MNHRLTRAAIDRVSPEYRESLKPGVAAFLGLSGTLALLAVPLSAQEARDATIILPPFGIYHDRALRREGENRWGWSAGVRFGVPIAHRVHALGTLSFLRTSNF